MSTKPTSDLQDRSSIDQLVQTFYAKVRKDAALGHIFDDVAKVDWPSHIPKIADFWDTVMFRSGTYKGNPLRAHAELVSRADMSVEMFQHWLKIFEETVDQLFAGENAEHIKRCAQDMAQVISTRINEIQHPPFISAPAEDH